MDDERPLRWSSIGRNLDFRLSNHRWMAALSLLGGVAAGIGELALRGQLLAAGVAAFGTGLAVFFGWAIGRELDPDHPRSALAAAIGSGAAALWLGPPSIIVSGWVLVMLRLIERTTGVPAQALDSLGTLGAAIWLGLARTPALTGLTALGLALDGWMAPSHRRQKVAALAAALLTVGAAIWTPVVPQQAQIPGPLIWALLFGLFFALPPGRGGVQAVADYTGEPLRPQRVRGGQFFAALALLVLVLIEGAAGLIAGSAVWTALAGITGFHVLDLAGGALRGTAGEG